jgi:phosphonate transport system substrate-binding protein
MQRWWYCVLAFFLISCQSVRAEDALYVDLSKRAALPVTTAAEHPALQMAVAAILSPLGTAESYRELADYLGSELERPVELVQRRTYAEVNALVAQQEVEIAFVCTSAYLDGATAQEMELLVAPEIDGQTTYYSQVIVPATSTTHSLGDLRGKTFAFTDPMSLTGRVYPTTLVRQIGQEPEQFFGDLFFTYSHERAIDAVAANVADGAAVDSVVLRYAFARDPDLQSKIRIIHTSPPFGMPPVVVPATLPAREKMRLQQILLDMSDNVQGQQVLERLGIERFVLTEDSAYDSARVLVAEAGDLP